MIKKVVIIDDEDYKKVLARIEKADEMLEGKWFDPKYAHWVRAREMLAQAIWDWEWVSGIFDKKYAEWEREQDAKERARKREITGNVTINREVRMTEEELTKY